MELNYNFFIAEPENMCDMNTVEVIESPPSYTLKYDPTQPSDNTTVLKFTEIFDISLYQCRPNRKAMLTVFTGGVDDSPTYSAYGDEIVTSQFGNAIEFQKE